MKSFNILVLAVVVAAIIVLGLHFKPKPPGGGAKPAAIAEAEIPAPALRPGAVDRLSVADGNGTSVMELRKTGGSWRLASPGDAPADAAMAERLITDSFAAMDAAPPPGGVAAADAGLAENRGVRVLLADSASGAKFAFRVGLSPAGDPFAAYVMGPGGAVALAKADLRGDLGLWENNPAALPRLADWLPRGVFAARPEEFRRIAFEDARRRLTLEKKDGTWTLAGGSPAGGASEPDPDSAEAWAKILSMVVPGEMVPSGGAPAAVAAGRSTVIAELADGRRLSLVAQMADDGRIFAEASTMPGVVFHMPEWRFERYFSRFADLFGVDF